MPFKNYKFSNQTKVLYRVLGQTNIKEAELFNDKEYDIGELKNLMPSKKIKNYQQKLI